MGRTKIRAGGVVEDALEDKDGDTKVEVEQSSNENKIRFSTSGEERAIIDDHGNVGVGTETPSEKLTINGVEGQSDETFIKFTEDDSDRALIGINSSNNILIENLYSNKHIVFKASDAGTSREGLRLDGAVPEVVVNQTSDSLVNFRVESDNNTHMLYVDGANDKVGIGTPAPGEALDVAGRIALKTTTDASGATDYAHIYSKDVSNKAEVFVRDEAGNVTQISPHNDEGEWQYFSRNVKTGKVVKVNMEKMIRRLEEITGESFMEEWYEDPTA